MSSTPRNVDASETARFSELASSWWDPHGRSRALHLLNPIRLEYLERRVGLRGRRVLDVGCGAGLLSEAMAHAGAEVTGIDASVAVLDAARAHLAQRTDGGETLAVRYHAATAEEWHARAPQRYDLVTCMELIEHVPDPASLVGACAGLTRPGGHVVLSTINRTPKAWALAVVGAEYVLGLLPRGTHDYRRFVRPSELDAWARRAELQLVDLHGLGFNPITERFRATRGVDVNYLAHLTRSAAPPDADPAPDRNDGDVAAPDEGPGRDELRR